MPVEADQKRYELLCVIVNYGQGSKVLKLAKQNGILGGTILLGKGTVNNRILELLELSEIRREIVLMIAERETAYEFLELLNSKFSLYKPNHGIACTSTVISILGTHLCRCEGNEESNEVNQAMYNAIFTIVDRGKAEDVVQSAKKAGARGGTIINARGSGIHEISKLFAMEIEPEKEIVLILAEKELTDSITSAIREDLQIDQPGNGIIFVQGVNKTYGLVNK